MQVCLAIGSNLGNKKENIETAISLLTNHCNISIINRSKIYETEPFGNIKQNWFLNIVIIAETQLKPEILLLLCKTIEFYLGRKTSPYWSERTIDIDIIMYDNLILNTTQLTIPHKYLHLRNFVLAPLNDITPNTIHPIFNKTITQLFVECPDNSIVKIYADI